MDIGKPIQAPAVHVKPGIQIRWNVSQEGQLVNLGINGATIEMDYEAALRVGQMLRVAGKRAKHAAGDTSRHWNIVADLRDAEENYKDLIAPNLRYSGGLKD